MKDKEGLNWSLMEAKVEIDEAKAQVEKSKIKQRKKLLKKFLWTSIWKIKEAETRSQL